MTPKWHQNDTSIFKNPIFTQMTLKWHQNDTWICENLLGKLKKSARILKNPEESQYYSNVTKMTLKWHVNFHKSCHLGNVATTTTATAAAQYPNSTAMKQLKIIELNLPKNQLRGRRCNKVSPVGSVIKSKKEKKNIKHRPMNTTDTQKILM